MRYDYMFEEGLLESYPKEILKNKYAVVEYPGTMMELIIDYADTKLEAYKIRKEQSPNAKVIEADIIFITAYDARILYSYKEINKD